MEQFVDFICNHWDLILSVAVFILSFILALLKKKPVEVVESLKGMLMQLLPYWINEAEAKFPDPKSGNDKINFVIHRASEWFEQQGFKFGLFYNGFVKDQVEQILSTPKKKGVK